MCNGDIAALHVATYMHYLAQFSTGMHLHRTPLVAKPNARKNHCCRNQHRTKSCCEAYTRTSTWYRYATADGITLCIAKRMVSVALGEGGGVIFWESNLNPQAQGETRIADEYRGQKSAASLSLRLNSPRSGPVLPGPLLVHPAGLALQRFKMDGG